MPLRVVSVASAVILLLFTGTGEAQTADNCGSGWILLNSTCYFLVLEPMNWSSALTNCQEKGAGLLSLKSETEQKLIEMKLATHERTWWVGPQRSTSSDGNSSDSTLVTLHENSSFSGEMILWNKGEPNNNKKNEDCVEIYPTGLLNDLPCSWSVSYICEKELEHNSSLNSCDNGWILILDSCYKFFNQHMLWTDAQASCKNSGATLLSLDNLSQLLQIKKEMNRINSNARWWVGLRKVTSDIQWKWLGTNRSFAPEVTLWNSGEPNNKEGNEDCVEMYSSGLLNDLPCDWSHLYICEKHLQHVNDSISSCGNGWILIADSCYKFSNQATKWTDAQVSCNADGADLLSLDTTEERLQIIKEIRRINSQATWWVRLRKVLPDVKWKWLEKPPVSAPAVTQWKKGESNGVLSKEDCVEMDSDGLLSEVPCSSSRYYICVKQSTRGSNLEDNCETGWFLISKACYSLPTKTMPWSEAQKSCQAVGGNLQSINTLHDLIKIQERVDLKSSPWWVGVRRASADGTWERDNGTQRCGMMAFDGTLVYEDCTASHSVICERNLITPRPRLEYTTEAITSTSTTTPLTTTTITSTSTATTTTATTSTTSSTPASSVVQEELPSSTWLSSSSTPSSTTTTAAPTTPAPTTSSTMTSTEKKKIPKPKPPETLPIENHRTLEDLYKLYSGCYLQEPWGGAKDMSFLYQDGSSTCPSIEVSQIVWPETSYGVTRDMKCRTGQGKAYFHCGGNPVCWRGQPNVDECASPEFKKILDQVKSTNDSQNPPEPEQTVALTTQLADVTESDDLTSDDVLATSKVISGLVTSGATQKLKDETEVEAIVSNVVKAGSNLVSTNKSRMWTEMPQQDKIRSATSLMVAMETATVAMAEKIDKPTVINTKDENIELELRVINITSVSPEEKEKIVYNAENSENTFSIPLETLSHLSHGGLAKVVFMTHYTMGDILGDTAGGDKADEGKKPDDTVHTRPGDSSKDDADDVEQETPAPKLASYILSASVGGQGEGRVKLPQPVTFTMKHLKMVPAGWDSLCSFWEISESQMGSWSQEGCRVVRSNASQTTCECDQMTNFAVLMAVQEVKVKSTNDSQNPPEPEQTVALTTQLANVTESDDLTSDDVLATSKVISGLVTSGATQKLKDETEVKAISLSTIATASSTPATTQTSSGKGQPEVTVTTMSSSGSSSLSNVSIISISSLHTFTLVIVRQGMVLHFTVVFSKCLTKLLSAFFIL
ncbi:cell wall protein DAN4-like isoform X3 [Pomacea canaliculata]|uniref:cell wall protein DAN4-like isoform X3 n=1 Tax=Pomacea canaliculata TaxID=400727 RepID=UPI000D736757|nr:cell wall protein DAN4-like isoform X3 [Pomacea canaliculata]